MTYQSRYVHITLAGETRYVMIERDSPKHCWFAVCSIMVKFPTGTKLHKRWKPQVTFWHDRGGEHCGFCQQVFHNRHCAPARWADPGEHGSGWNTQPAE